jgi:heme/copper-type cytochrome/quinol oxidase subunit 2
MSNRAILLLLVSVGLAVAFAPLPDQLIPATERTFYIQASQFAYKPAEISVNPGDKITINLTSMDVVHGLYVDGYDISVSADPGQTATLSFVADKAGSFRMRCNVTCGAMHPFMIGKLNVGVNAWLYRSILLAFISIIAIFVLARRQSGKINSYA